MKKISVMVVENQSSIREGFKALLNFVPDIDVVAEAASADEAVENAIRDKPDVILMDLHMPSSSSILKDGFGATAAICKEWPEAKILILTNWDGDENVHRALACGAKGYILKDADFEEIAKAIRTLQIGKRYIWSEIANQLSERESLPKLSPTETKILELMAEGASNEKIAELVQMSIEQVKTSNVRLYKKIGVGNRVEAVNCGRRRGLIPPL
jgi:two-component system, NarL family, response regulator